MSLIAVDLDGTLLNDKKYISIEDRKIMKKICENNSIIIVSGRSHSDIKKIISSNNIEKSILPLIICRNGQEIYDINNENIIYEEYMQFNTIKKVIETLEENKIYWYCLSNDIVYCKELRFNCLNYKESGKFTINEIKDIDGLARMKIEKFVINEPFSRNMIRIKNAIKKLYDVEFMMYDLNKKYKKMQFMQNIIMKRGINKYKTLIRLKELLKLSDNVISFGDGFNDYELIKYATFGICMENGNKKIKKISKFITKSNNNSGFSFAINYLLESKIIE